MAYKTFFKTLSKVKPDVLNLSAFWLIMMVATLGFKNKPMVCGGARMSPEKKLQRLFYGVFIINLAFSPSLLSSPAAVLASAFLGFAFFQPILYQPACSLASKYFSFLPKIICLARKKSFCTINISFLLSCR